MMDWELMREGVWWTLEGSESQQRCPSSTKLFANLCAQWYPGVDEGCSQCPLAEDC